MPVARTKTFTGCWTCRARKIKCDLQRPVCKRCEKANIECEGYSIKLRWSNTKGDKDDEDFFQRRNVDFVEYPPGMMYETYDEMDSTLAKLHSPELQGDETKSLGPFGVFDGMKRRPSNQKLSSGGRRKRNKTSESSTPKEVVKKSPPSVKSKAKPPINNEVENGGNAAVFADGELDEFLYTLDGGAGYGNMFENMFETNYQELKDELSTLVATDSNFAPFTSDLFDDDTVATAIVADNSVADTGADNGDNSASTSNIVSPLLFASIIVAPTQHYYYLSTDYKFGIATHSLYFTAEARYLLHHYCDQVTSIMTVMTFGHEKNPWATIYLPRAIAAIGDLTSKGTTLSARNALMHALLSVSAYHLQSRFAEGSVEKAHWADVGLQLKGEAYKWLSECLVRDLATQRYKDVLTAVLSMVSIDVISGLMSDCRVHLSACKSIVNMRCRMRPKISQKAAVLHRIAGFLGLMQSSTALDPADRSYDNKIFNDQWLNVRLEDFEVPTTTSKSHSQSNSSSNSPFNELGSSLSYMNEESEFQEYWTKYKPHGAAGEQLDDEFYKKELVTTQTLYGIPDSLLLLFSRVCKITQQAVYYNDRDLKLPRELAKECADVEAGLIQWQTRYDINNKRNFFRGEARDALNHHVFAFHQSLIIYYFRLVRDLNPDILHANVVAVFDHLETIQQINRGKPVAVCVPLMFPGFMAACEIPSNQPDLRSRCKSWLDQQAVEGVGTYISATRVIAEVWRRRDSGEQRADWWKVLYDWKMNLMLS